MHGAPEHVPAAVHGREKPVHNGSGEVIGVVLARDVPQNEHPRQQLVVLGEFGGNRKPQDIGRPLPVRSRGAAWAAAVSHNTVKSGIDSLRMTPCNRKDPARHLVARGRPRNDESRFRQGETETAFVLGCVVVGGGGWGLTTAAG
jgi:hypothetical protein